MKRDQERGDKFTRRAFIIGALQGGLLTVLGGRLAYLQIVQGKRYRLMADANRISLRLLAPSRGLILDRAGTPLAINGQNFRVVLVPEQTDDLALALSHLQKLVPLTQRDIQRVIKQAEHTPSFAPLEVKENLNWEEVSRVELNLPDLPGISIDEGEERQYPLSEAAAHLIGYVGAVNKAELSNGGEDVLALPGFQIGKSGVEKFFDRDLRGSAGNSEVEVNVVGRAVRELHRDTGKPGATLQLTIDATLQKYMQERLSQERSASAVVMDAVNGAVYALSSSPSFDPNLFTHGITPDVWEDMMSDPALPMNNKAVDGLYPPGSCFKMVTATAGLETGVINENTTVYCPGYYNLGNATFHCWKHQGHGTISVVEAITHSCDVFFYKISTDIGVDRLASYARKFGLGGKTGIELPEERSGLFPTTAWKRATIGESWQGGETLVTAIGQGYTQVTPVQLATMTARLVNGGNSVSPRLALNTVTAENNAGASLGLARHNIDLVLRGMGKVVNDPTGTAFAARIKEPRFAMGGKTGSAQVKHMTKAERAANQKNDELPWNLRDQALFIGFAPISNPRYVCSVVVEHGMHGGSASAPIARDLLTMVQQRNPAGISYPPSDSDNDKDNKG